MVYKWPFSISNGNGCETCIFYLFFELEEGSSNPTTEFSSR